MKQKPKTPSHKTDDPLHQVEKLLIEEERERSRRPTRLRLFRMILGPTLTLGAQAVGYLNAREAGIILLLFLISELGLALQGRHRRGQEDQREP